jgi:hypothetical protein
VRGARRASIGGPPWRNHPLIARGAPHVDERGPREVIGGPPAGKPSMSAPWSNRSTAKVAGSCSRTFRRRRRRHWTPPSPAAPESVGRRVETSGSPRDHPLWMMPRSARTAGIGRVSDVNASGPRAAPVPRRSWLACRSLRVGRDA